MENEGETEEAAAHVEELTQALMIPDGRQQECRDQNAERCQLA
jgi:hypothetical protein